MLGAEFIQDQILQEVDFLVGQIFGPIFLVGVKLQVNTMHFFFVFFSVDLGPYLLNDYNEEFFYGCILTIVM